ncbi:MAG: type II toxin-antitoxin system VapC family toxin [Acidimicrobiales bacterium]
MDAFDADVLIYAAVPGHPLGAPVLTLFPEGPPNAAGALAGVGSTLLLPEILTKPTRETAHEEVAALAALLARLDLRPVDEATAALSVALGASYRLSSADSVHLATAVLAGADRFVTNNRRDFSQSIEEVSVTYPADLP